MTEEFNPRQKWTKRFEKRFDALDVNKNGYVTIEEILTWPDTLKELCHATTDDVQHFRECLIQFMEAIGIVPGKNVSKEEWVQGTLSLAKDDLARKKAGKETYYERLHNALFDVTDTNKDGTLSLDEVRIMMQAFSGMDQPGAAEALFKMADKNHNGRIERKELIELKFNFWFNPEDETAKGLFGGAFE